MNWSCRWTIDGALMLTVRSGAGGGPTAGRTCVDTVAELVNCCADFAAVTVAVFCSVVPAAAVTLPRIVTVQLSKPWNALSEHVTREFDCLHVPRVLCSTRLLVPSTPVRPFTWSVIVALLSLAPLLFDT